MYDVTADNVHQIKHYTALPRGGLYLVSTTCILNSAYPPIILQNTSGLSPNEGSKISKSNEKGDQLD